MKKQVLYHIRSLASGEAEKQLIYTAIAAGQNGYDVKILITHSVLHYENMLRNHRIDIVVACKTSLKYRFGEKGTCFVTIN